MIQISKSDKEKQKKKEKKEKMDAEDLKKRNEELKKEMERERKRTNKIENLLEEKGRGGVYKYLLYEKEKRKLSEFERKGLKNLRKLVEGTEISEEEAKNMPSKEINKKIAQKIEKSEEEEKTGKYIR